MKILSFILLGLLLFSCEEKFSNINYEELNQKISQSSKKLSPKDIMKIYYPKEVGFTEGNQKIIIKEQVLKNGNVEVELIHDNQLDDSVRGEKYLLELRKHNKNWLVVSLKYNWRCWNGRGHSSWGIKFCN